MSTRRTLSTRPLSYDAVAVTAPGQAVWSKPLTYRSYEKTVKIGNGSNRWAFASDAVLAWGIKTRSGFTVLPDDGLAAERPVRLGRRYWLVAHLGSLRVKEPIQVVAVIEEPDRKGFAYGTLVGHPVSGEEAFIVERRTDGSLWFTIRFCNETSRGPVVGRAACGDVGSALLPASLPTSTYRTPRISRARGVAERPTFGSGGQSGTTLHSSATDLTPDIGSSKKPHPGPASNHSKRRALAVS
jgi:uncharacterized protein (UPF0548 family)